MGLLVPDEKRRIAKKYFSSAQNATGYYSGPETPLSADDRLRACWEITQKCLLGLFWHLVTALGEIDWAGSLLS